MFFFFQAEDGIRDDLVTGVQTCALPISPSSTATSTATPTAPPVISSTKSGSQVTTKRSTDDSVDSSEHEGQ